MNRPSTLLLLILMASCSNKTVSTDRRAPEKQAPADETVAEEQAPPKAQTAVALASEIKKPAPEAKVEKKVIRSYRGHLLEGRALQKAEKWDESVVEFEKALLLVKVDARALSELGWSAFKAGDFKKSSSEPLATRRS